MVPKSKEMMISQDPYEARAAVVEDTQLVEIYMERIDNPPIVGNIYLGKVKDVLPGMEAAFVDIGVERNAFLYIKEVIMPEDDVDSVPRKIQHLLKPGQEILVQVSKEPMGKKGARVTTQITIPGRYLVLLPFGDLVGISRRLDPSERTRLRTLCDEIKPKNMGLIVRTAAQDVGVEELRRDLAYLRRLWTTLSRRIKRAKAPRLIHAEMELPLRTIRDVVTMDYNRIWIDDPRMFKKVHGYLKQTSPSLMRKLKLYEDSLPLFDKYRINEEVKKALNRKVWLRSGGYITIDGTEALTAIDVNTGKYVGKTSLEETIFQTNLEAAQEVVRQLRLRDIGGIIVIDFIDMENPRNRDEVFLSLNKALENDRIKSRVIEISRLGLVEMTRKNVSDGLLEYLSDRCPCCGGTGKIISNEAQSIDIGRKILKICIGSKSEALLFKVNSEVAHFLEGKRQTRIKKLQGISSKKILLYGQDECPIDTAELVREGSRREVTKVLRTIRKGDRGQA
jgi:ribonuclease G